MGDAAVEADCVAHDRLRGIQFHGIDEFLDLTEQSKDIEYTVSWVDATSTGRNFARGVFMQGDHSAKRDELKPSAKPKLVFPFDAPGFALNSLSVSAFNTLFFHKQIHSRVVSLQDYEPFFYPLDKVLHWNRMYGSRGLLQFQYVIPWDNAKEGTVRDSPRGCEVGACEFSCGAEGVWRCAFAGDDEFSEAGNYPCSRFSN